MRRSKRAREEEPSTPPSALSAHDMKRAKMVEVDKPRTDPDSPSSRRVREALSLSVGSITSEAEFEEKFQEMANVLMNHCTLWVNHQEHRIVELEFYFTSELHNDPFTHCMEEQEHCGQWYFHRSSPGVYKGGTYKGLDIAIGQGPSSPGGMLIRSILPLSGGESGSIVCGPCNCVDHILSECDAPSISDFVSDTLRGNLSVSDAASPLHLSHGNVSYEELPVYQSGRVGLFMTKRGVADELQQRFVFKPYRALVSPKQISKGKMLLVLELIRQGHSDGQIKDIVGGRVDIITRYRQNMSKGVGLSDGSRFMKKLNTEELCKAFGMLMAGDAQEAPKTEEETNVPAPRSRPRKAPKKAKGTITDFFASTGPKKAVETEEADEEEEEEEGVDSGALPSGGLIDLITDVGWKRALASEFQEPYMQSLEAYLDRQYATNTIYPERANIFSALNITPLKKVKVVILGQDPYHGPNQAHGMAFSVCHGVTIPPSLRNIYRELSADLGSAFQQPSHGNLTRWAEQGVLLLNATLTVQRSKPNSHAKMGWQQFTDAIIELINSKRNNVVFILWGGFAHRKGKKINTSKHHVIKSAHPSPLSVTKFRGSKPFSKTNNYLRSTGQDEIDWNVD